MADGGKKNEFVIVNEMLYEKFQAYKLQKKGYEKKDTLMVFPDSHGLVESAMSNFYPQNSDNYLLFIGEKEGNRDFMEGLLIPAYNMPTAPTISQNCTSSIMYQFFYYFGQQEGEEEYIFYVFHGGDYTSEITFDGQMVLIATQTNGDLVDKQIIDFYKSTGKSTS